MAKSSAQITGERWAIDTKRDNAQPLYTAVKELPTRYPWEAIWLPGGPTQVTEIVDHGWTHRSILVERDPATFTTIKNHVKDKTLGIRPFRLRNKTLFRVIREYAHHGPKRLGVLDYDSMGRYDDSWHNSELRNEQSNVDDILMLLPYCIHPQTGLVLRLVKTIRTCRPGGVDQQDYYVRARALRILKRVFEKDRIVVLENHCYNSGNQRMEQLLIKINPER